MESMTTMRGSRKSGKDFSARSSTAVVHKSGHGAGGAVQTSPTMFADADVLKEEAHKDLDKRDFDIVDFYKSEGFCQWVARSQLFGNITLLIICMNALWIGTEMDLNKEEKLSEADWYFQVGEYFFFAFFCFEWVVRCGALRKKRDGLRDKWLIFDSGLVFLMIAETAVMPLIMAISAAASGNDDDSSNSEGDSGMGNLSMLRMFRLLRLTRMVRFMRAVPELVTLLKSMTIALRSVASTLLLLVIFMYIFAIIFKSQMKTDDEYLERKFGRIPSAMWTLLMSGAFMDSLSICANSLLENSILLTVIFICFIFLSSFTVLNMLIGLLCEVVTAVAAAEKEKAIVVYVKGRLFDVLESLDADKSGTISKDEFEELLAVPEAVSALDDLGVDVPNLMSLSDHLFEAAEMSRMGIEGVEKERKRAKDNDEDPSSKDHAANKEKHHVAAMEIGKTSSSILENKSDDGSEEEAKLGLTFADFLEMVIRLRADNRPSVLDITDLRKLVLKSHKQALANISDIDNMNIALANDMEDVTSHLDHFCKAHKAYLSEGKMKSHEHRPVLTTAGRANQDLVLDECLPDRSCKLDEAQQGICVMRDQGGLTSALVSSDCSSSSQMREHVEPLSLLGPPELAAAIVHRANDQDWGPEEWFDDCDPPKQPNASSADAQERSAEQPWDVFCQAAPGALFAQSLSPAGSMSSPQHCQGDSDSDRQGKDPDG